MKKYFLYFFAIIISCDVFSQNNTKVVANISSTTTDNPWDLNRYVWSHANADKKKGSKPPLNFEALDNWLSLNEYLSVSDNGEYFAYGIQRGSNYSKRLDSIIVQSTKNTGRFAFKCFLPGFFSSDSKLYIFNSQSGLCFLHNDTKEIEVTKDVLSYKTPLDNSKFWIAYLLKGNTLVLRNLLTGIEKKYQNVATYDFDRSGQWLLITLNDNEKELIVYNVNSDRQLQYKGVNDFIIDVGGESMVLKTVEKANGEMIKSLRVINLLKQVSDTIWSTLDSNTIISDIATDIYGKRVVFIVSVEIKAGYAAEAGKSDQIDNTIWYWQEGAGKASMVINHEMPGIPPNMQIVAGASFVENNNNCIQFTLQFKPESLTQDKGYGVQVDIWNYKDSILQSNQLSHLNELIAANCKAIYNLQTGLVIQLEKEGYQLKCINGDFAVIAKSRKRQYGYNNPSARFWENGYDVDSNWLVDLQDNSRLLLPATRTNDLFLFSPSGKYLIFNDSKLQCHYFSYELATGNLVNISKKISAWKLGYYDDVLIGPQYPAQCVGIAGWLGDSILLVYDNFDIWQLNITGREPPVNLTNGYGRRNNIIFSLFNSSQPQQFFEPIKPISVYKDSKLLIRAFNRQNRFNGFYTTNINVKGDPVKLYMGAYLFSAAKCVDVDDHGMVPVKAKDNNIWIVKRQSATDAPNYFSTTDFKNYNRLTNLQPHLNYNWLTSELHSFKQLDGSTGYGVLYKPENFDSTKKYPVIITFYFHLSDRPYQYPKPGYIIIPSIWDDPTWMVSHGYLVFVADIYFSTEKLGWGSGVMNSLEGAANYLSRKSYVDKKAIGAAGHSNSGRFGYYLFTHSHLFAAMAIGAGTGGVNAISTTLSNEAGGDWLKWGESDVRLGNLWKNKSVWIDHTAVLQVDKAKSPLLLFFNKNDHGNGLYSYQLYISLRRLDKKIWWLQYDKEGHTLGWPEDQKDFTLRYTQFFDHYLKGAPAPEWMTKGVPANLKGIVSGYSLDSIGTCGANCVSCKRVQSKKVSSK